MNKLKYEICNASNVIHLADDQNEEVIGISQNNFDNEKRNLLNFSAEKLVEIVSLDEALSRRRYDYGFLDLLAELFVFSAEQKKALVEELNSEREKLQFTNVHELNP